MKTFQHKSSAVLATLTEKTVWMSNLEGNIYKQFPLQHFKPEQFLDELVPFPGNFDEAKAKFLMANDEKKQKKAHEAEARRLKAYEERKGKLLYKWKLRKAVWAGKELHFTMVVKRAVLPEGSMRDNYLGVHKELVFFTDEEEYEKDKEEIRKDKPEYGIEYEMCYGTIRPTIDEWMNDYEDGDDFNAYDEEYEFITHDYESLEGCILVAWSWQTHVGYCRKLHEVFRPYGCFETTEDLISGNEDNVYRTNYSILLTKKEVDTLRLEEDTFSCDSLEDLIAERLNRGWQWDRFEKFTADKVGCDSRIHI